MKKKIKNISEHASPHIGNLRFTLIEILLVVVIMVLLMSIMLPAFEDMASGGGLKAGTRQISQILKLARSYAITEKEYVGVVFPMILKKSDKSDYDKTSIGYMDLESVPSPPLSDTGIDVDKYYNRVYRVCVLRKDPNDHDHYYFKHWIPGEPWRSLPKSVIFIGSSKTMSIARHGASIKNDGKYLTFNVHNIDYTDIGGNKPSSSVDIPTPALAFTPSGRCGGGRNRLTVMGEGIVSGGEPVLTNVDQKAWGFVETNQYGKTFVRISVAKDE